METMVLNKLKKILKQNWKIDINNICKTLDITERELLSLIGTDILSNEKYSVSNGIITKKKPEIDQSIYYIDNNKSTLNFLLKGDTHLSINFDPKKLNEQLLELMFEENIDYVLDCGDLCHGSKYALQRVSYETELDYLVENVPHFYVPQLIVSGNHDDDWYEETGKEILRDLSDRREDIEYLGANQRHIQIGNLNIRLAHGDLTLYGNNLNEKYKQLNLYRNMDFIHLGHTHNAKELKINNDPAKYFMTGSLKEDKTVYIVNVDFDQNMQVKEIKAKQKILK